MSSISNYLNALPRRVAEATLLRCCSSSRWARRLAAQRPFSDDESLFHQAQVVWEALDPRDWLEAFSGHPRIGERRPEGKAADGTSTWSRQEQSGVDKASYETQLALHRGNVEYEQRFGHVFLICATGKSAQEMLSSLQERLAHAPQEELHIAASEQAKITRLRLEKLLRDAPPKTSPQEPPS
ncbi:MAG: 2-oxo-4-hydroxy-4-carboxy-5-ureidoimidazoline decarboxylase [Deltaproteobacteria bacterium]|nr:2-oxo-4-hydroxy-4-carboxy-5-ureidoimidazoline decarboxylase [Deltaproteobacteria bacterium]